MSPKCCGMVMEQIPHLFAYECGSCQRLVSAQEFDRTVRALLDTIASVQRYPDDDHEDD